MNTEKNTLNISTAKYFNYTYHVYVVFRTNVTKSTKLSYTDENGVKYKDLLKYITTWENLPFLLYLFQLAKLVYIWQTC